MRPAPRNIVCVAFALIGAGIGVCFNEHSFAPFFLAAGGFLLGWVVPMHSDPKE